MASKQHFSQLGMRMRGLGFHALVIGGYALLTVVLTYPLVLHLSTHIPSFPSDLGIGDTWVNMWVFGFIHRVVTESAHWSLFTDTIFYPRGVDITIPLVFGVGLPLFISIPFVHFLGIVVTYNLFIIGSFILTAFVAFLLIRYLTNDTRAAWVSGMIFAFTPYQMVRALAHLNILASGVLIPLYILLFIKAMKYGMIRNTLWASFILVLTILFNLYYAFFLCLFTIIYTLYHLYSEKDSNIKGSLLKQLFSMGWITSVSFLPIAWVLLTHSWEDFHTAIPRSISLKYGADMLAFFLPSSFHPLWGNLVKHFEYYYLTGEHAGEQIVYLGYAVLALSVIAIWKAPKSETRFWTLLALAFFVLALGAFLHINGKNHLLDFYGTPTKVPLPYLLILSIPLLNTLRVASRSSIMVVLALAVLAGYGTRHLLRRLKERSGARLFFLGFIMTIIGLEFLTIPFPLTDAKIPAMYQKIATEDRRGSTLLNVPLHWSLSKYEYYQTTHGKRLLLGQTPRISLELLTTYADSVSLMKVFKNPELIQDYDESTIKAGEVTKFIEFFDLSFIVIHKDLLGSDVFDQLSVFPRGSKRLEAPEMFEQLMRFLLAHFPIAHVQEEDNIVALQLARSEQSADRAAEPASYLFDIGSHASQVFLTEGLGSAEREGEFTYAWSTAAASQLWVRVAHPEDYLMELRLLALPEGPPQGVTIYANGQSVGEVGLEAQGWHLYTVRVPKAFLTSGLNSFRFTYRYTTSQATSSSSHRDDRKLAVAFDFIRLRSESDMVPLEQAGYRLDLGMPASQVFLAEGLEPAERGADLTYAWANAAASQVWVRLAQPDDFVMEMRLLALPDGPPQEVTIYANGQLVGGVALEALGWHVYTIRVPKAFLSSGLNKLRFVYRYVASASAGSPGSTEGRKLAMGFDFIQLRAVSDMVPLDQVGSVLDFGAAASQVFLTEGLGPAEHAREVTYAWATAAASQVWIRLPYPEDYVMGLQLMALPEGPPQGVTIYANDQLVGELGLEAEGWHLYTVRVPKAFLIPGLNNLRFVYRHVVSPAEIFPGNTDDRRLAVAFDFIRLRAEE